MVFWRRLLAGQPQDERAASIARRSRSAAYTVFWLLVLGYAGFKLLVPGQAMMPVTDLLLLALVAGLYEQGLRFWLSAEDPPSREHRNRTLRRLAVVAAGGVLFAFVLSVGLGIFLTTLAAVLAGAYALTWFIMERRRLPED